MAEPTQDRRLLKLTTPLGKDVLLLQSLEGVEGVSRPFSFDLELLSLNNSIQPASLVGQRVCIAVQLADGSERYFNGFVSRFAQGRRDFRYTHYEMRVVPWLWFLTRTADCRIFQNLKPPDIISKIFNDLGFTDFRLSLTGSYEKRDYCVQYRETDFNFVSRLMEQYGIFYFFEHTDSKHTMVLADSVSAIKPCPKQAKARYEQILEASALEDMVEAWSATQEMRPGKYALKDYNFETPSTNLFVSTSSTIKIGGNDKYEVYDYPGEYLQKGEGDSLAKLRIEEEEALSWIAQGRSNCRAFTTGYSFDLVEHYRPDMNKAYLLTEIRHSATAGSAYATETGGAEIPEHYSNQFTCIPKSVVFRPPRLTPRPVVQGPQTAVVVGAAGEEIYVDKYGRVKVQFHWDREGARNEKSSCWVRVSQPWGGKNWGGMWIPRIGQEVIVEFLEGDPDQPLITGRVYNAEQMPPYELPKHHTRSTMKSRSSKGGSASNFNELRFEDLKGKEQVFLHAELDMDQRVKNDSREHIGKDRHLIVKGDRREKIDGETHLAVGKDHFEKFGSNMNSEVVMDLIQKIGKNMSVQVVMDRNEKSGKKWAHEAGMEIHLKAGMNLVLEGGLQVTLKGPGGFVNINPAGVFIQGNMVFINSGGAAGAGTGASPDSPKAPKDPDEADDGSKGTKM